MDSVWKKIVSGKLHNSHASLIRNIHKEMLNLKIIQHLADNKPVRVIFLIMIEKKKSLH